MIKHILLLIFLWSFSFAVFAAPKPNYKPIEAHYIQECNERVKTCAGAIILKNAFLLFPKEMQDMVKRIQKVVHPTIDMGYYGKIKVVYWRGHAKITWKVRY